MSFSKHSTGNSIGDDAPLTKGRELLQGLTFSEEGLFKVVDQVVRLEGLLLMTQTLGNTLERLIKLFGQLLFSCFFVFR